MFKIILKKVLIITVLFCLLPCGNLFADTSMKIAILPFSLDSKQPNDKLKEKILLLISQQLEEEGTKVVIPELEPGLKPGLKPELRDDITNWDFSQFRKFGIKTGVDYILTGSIFLAGQSISINSKLINIYEKKNFTSIYADADTPENLFSAITKLSKEITGKLYQQQIIINIAVTGNKRVESDAILRILDTNIGDIYKSDNISNDLRKIYEMGYFDNVVIEKQEIDSGVKLIFKITEKATIRRVSFKDNTIYEDEELSDIVSTRTGAILNIHKLNSDIDKMRMMLTEKNYHNCSVNYKIIPFEHSQADIVFSFVEGKKLKVEKITIKGNNHFSDKQINKAIETKEKGFFSFFTSSGDLNEIEVQNDVIRIETLYKNNGFIDAKVSDPDIKVGEKIISIHFNIEEGPQYKVKNIDITGDLILPKEAIFEIMQSKEEFLYNRENIRKDINAISDIYSNEGFAKVNVNPLVKKIEKEKMMNITYAIDQGPLIHFNRVNISGNLKTKDKVIRREIKVDEQDIYSKKNIQESFKHLNRLDYFEEIDIQPVETFVENEMDLNINVVEKRTGSFSVGGGFSSSDGGFVSASVQERNLFGGGQTIKLEAKLSKKEVLFDINYFEPYIMDTKISGGIGIYREEKEYDYYDKESMGLFLSLGYRLFDYTKIGVKYNIEDFKITNVDSAKTYMTSGDFLTSNITPYIQYDSRNDLFLPTEGYKHKLSVEYAGEFVGGDIDYIRVLAETGVYFPLFWKFTGALHAEAGYIDDKTSNDISIDHIKFYLGGMKSVRGFDNSDINANHSGDIRDIGGEKYLQFNAELTFPITEKYKLAGVFFYDRGDVYREDENIDFADQFSSCGTGFRWNSPVGPLRIEYAWVIDGRGVKERGDGKFEFSVGASF